MATDLWNVGCVPCSATGLLWLRSSSTACSPMVLTETPARSTQTWKHLSPQKLGLLWAHCVQNHSSTNIIPLPRIRPVLRKSWGLFASWNYFLPQAGQFSKQIFQAWALMYWAKAQNGIPPGTFSHVFASDIALSHVHFTCDTIIFLVNHQQQKTGLKNAQNNLSCLYAGAQDIFSLPLLSPTDFLGKMKLKVKLAQIKTPLISALLWIKKPQTTKWIKLEVCSFRKVNIFTCISASMSTTTGQEIKLIRWQYSWSSTPISLKKKLFLLCGCFIQGQSEDLVSKVSPG